MSLHTSPQAERWLLTIRPQRPLRHLEHPGSMLRGLFGHALKQRLCRCGQEKHHADCAYQLIFEPQPPQNWPARYQDCPPAYVISPQPAPEGVLRAAFTLMGPALTYRHLLPEVWKNAIARGLGESAVPAELQAITPLALTPLPSNTHSLKLTFSSPLLLKRKRFGQTESQPLEAHEITPADLLLALHRRLALLQPLYQAPGIQLPPLEQWLGLADGLELHSELQTTYFRRRSNRQQRQMTLCGLVGDIYLSGAFTPELLNALSIGQWFNLGGKASFGMGSYQLSSRYSLAY